jgi:SAM-dependent methyltransferase
LVELLRALLITLLSTSMAHGEELDAQGRNMLDPLRNEALRPSELIKRLNLAPDLVIADIGAGPGFFTLPLAHAVPKGYVLATDIRDDYLAFLLQRARREKLANVRIERVPPDDPALAPRSIDVAFLCQVDHYLRNRQRYFEAIIPALKPGARIVLVNYQRYRAADLEAATRVGLHVVSEWAPSPPFFMMVLAKK